MSRHPFAPDVFALGMFAFGLVLLLFPAMRVAGLAALSCSVAYWLVMTALTKLRR